MLKLLVHMNDQEIFFIVFPLIICKKLVWFFYMVKSKFQAKAQVKVGVNSKVKKPKSKYYDEHISKTESSKSNNGFAIFVVVCIIVGASVSGIIIASNKIDEDPDDPNGTGSGIQDGDTIVFKYDFFIDFNDDKDFSGTELADNDARYEWTVKENTIEEFPPGLYYNLLGMKVGDIKTFIIPANVDNNDDGIDDFTGIPVWESDDHNFMEHDLKYDVEIFEIK